MIDSTAFYLSSILGLGKKTKFPGTIASFTALFFSFLTYYFLMLIILGFYDLNFLYPFVLLLVMGGAISALAHRLGYLIKINNAKQ